MASSSAPSHALAWMVVACPFVVAIQDSLFRLTRVRGSSMEPALKNNDILLVRKADFPLWRRWWDNNNNNKWNNNNTQVDKKFWEEDPNDTSQPSMRDRRVRDYEYQQTMAEHNLRNAALFGLYQYPPTPSRGKIVTYRSPYKYPPELIVKRVVAVAGQVVETKEGLKDVPINRLWVEGDNQESSQDSRQYGAINQHLVVGVAEYCVWPASRMGKLATTADDKRSYWLH